MGLPGLHPTPVPKCEGPGAPTVFLGKVTETGATRPEDWAWSSYRHYATGAAGTVVIESKWTAFRRGNRLPDGWEAQKNVG
jgi:hypothetical protein